VRRKKTALKLFVAMLGVVVAFLGALGMQERMRPVDIVTLFGGGVSAGAGLAAAIAGIRRRQNIFPAVRYHDGRAALAWLNQAFGFSRKLEMPGPNGTIAHAELRLGNGTVMLGSIGKPDNQNPWTAATHGLYVYVPDLDAHYARARQAGAEIVRELHDTTYGAREYSARDLEGQLWSFGTYYPAD
jgi:uncharacterized glyoxalase superfamily protein PhnB